MDCRPVQSVGNRPEAAAAISQPCKSVDEVFELSLIHIYLVQDSHIDREQLDEIVDLIVDTVCSARKVIRSAGDDYPAEVVKSRFMKLDSSHVQYEEEPGFFVFRCSHNS